MGFLKNEFGVRTNFDVDVFEFIPMFLSFRLFVVLASGWQSLRHFETYHGGLDAFSKC